MNTKTLGIAALGILLVIAIAYWFLASTPSNILAEDIPLDATPQQVTLSGTYTCLPYRDGTVPEGDDCTFGLRSDSGEYYAVNFGASAEAMRQFQEREHITAEGFVVIREALSSDHWMKFNMKGVFTVTKMLQPSAPQGKINIQAVCEGALAYMSFPDGASADAFVQACIQGEHPEVIERFKVENGLGDGAAI